MQILTVENIERGLDSKILLHEVIRKTEMVSGGEHRLAQKIKFLVSFFKYFAFISKIPIL